MKIIIESDDYQSIYQFRGSDIGIILSFQDYFKSCEVIKLEQNYRSTQNIVNISSAFIRSNSGQLEKNLYSEKEIGSKVRTIQLQDERKEAEYIAARIKQMIMLENYNFNDFAILYRSAYQSEAIEAVLRENLFPYNIIGGVGFFQREEIKDIVSYLRAISNPKDDAALLRIMNKPARKIGKTTQDTIEKYANEYGVSIYRSLKNVEDIATLKKAARGAVDDFLSLLSHLVKRSEEMNSLPAFIRYAIDHTGLMKLYRDRAHKNDFEKERIENIEQFICMVEKYAEDNPDKGLQDFMQDASLLTDTNGDSKYGPNEIRLMTIHASKGLEFPVVFCPGWNKRVFPGWQSISPEAIAEERRVGYVALSRAEKHLEITCVRERKCPNGKGTEFLEPSPFLSELPVELKEEFIL